jgi:hypothetical protein
MMNRKTVGDIRSGIGHYKDPLGLENICPILRGRHIGLPVVDRIGQECRDLCWKLDATTKGLGA